MCPWFDCKVILPLVREWMQLLSADEYRQSIVPLQSLHCSQQDLEWQNSEDRLLLTCRFLPLCAKSEVAPGSFANIWLVISIVNKQEFLCMLPCEGQMIAAAMQMFCLSNPAGCSFIFNIDSKRTEAKFTSLKTFNVQTTGADWIWNSSFYLSSSCRWCD